MNKFSFDHVTVIIFYIKTIHVSVSGLRLNPPSCVPPENTLSHRMYPTRAAGRCHPQPPGVETSPPPIITVRVVIATSLTHWNCCSATRLKILWSLFCVCCDSVFTWIFWERVALFYTLPSKSHHSHVFVVAQKNDFLMAAQKLP